MNTSQLYTAFYSQVNADKKQAPRGLAIKMAEENGMKLQTFYRKIREETKRRVTLLQAKRVCRYKVDKDAIDRLIHS